MARCFPSASGLTVRPPLTSWSRGKPSPATDCRRRQARGASTARCWPAGGSAQPQPGRTAAVGRAALWGRPLSTGGSRMRAHRASPRLLVASRARLPPGVGGYVVEEDEEAEEEEDFKQGGWLWTNDAAAQTKARLNAQKLRPKKSLGQNFVTDDTVLERVVRAANIKPGDMVLEIGPGTGNLTRHLLAAGALVTAVEKDHRLIDQLAEELSNTPSFKLISGDILRMDALELAQLTRSSHGLSSDARIKVVANLPYYITTDVLKKLLPLGDTFSNLIFMLQEEVAQRFAIHQPGNRDYRYMSVFCRFYSEPVYKFRISRDVYFPKPKVDGAVVDFKLFKSDERLEVDSDTGFLKLVHGAFLHRRKMMKNSVALPSEEVAGALLSRGLNPESRAQDLSLDDFGGVYHYLRSHLVEFSAASDDDIATNATNSD